MIGIHCLLQSFLDTMVTCLLADNRKPYHFPTVKHLFKYLLLDLVSGQKAMLTKHKSHVHLFVMPFISAAMLTNIFFCVQICLGEKIKTLQTTLRKVRVM